MFYKGDKVKVISTEQIGLVTEDQIRSDDIVTVEIEEKEYYIDPDDLELVEPPGSLADPFTQELPEQIPSTVGGLDWVTQDQIAVLTQWWGAQQWQSSLTQWLDSVWQGWQWAEADQKHQWLTEQLAYHSNYGTTTTTTTNTNTTASRPTVTVPDDFSWLDQRQRTTFERWWGQSWEDQASQWLTGQWAGWRDAQDLIKMNWLTQHLQAIEAAEQSNVDPAIKQKREREEEFQSRKRARNTEVAALKGLNEHLNDLRTKKREKGRPANIKSRDDFVSYAQTLDREDQENLIEVYNSGVMSTRGYNNDDFISMTDIGGEEETPEYVDHWGEGAAHDPQTNAENHYAKHGNEHHFNYGDAGEYTQAALDFKKANSRFALAQNRKDNVSIICRYSRSQGRGEYLVLDPNGRIVSFYPLGSSEDVERYLGSKVDASNKSVFID